MNLLTLTYSEKLEVANSHKNSHLPSHLFPFQPIKSIKSYTYKYLLIYLHNFKIHKYSGITNEEQKSYGGSGKKDFP